MSEKEEKIRKLAELHHEEWMEWSKEVMKEIMGGPDKTKYQMAITVFEIHQRWLEYWKDYSRLDEEIKEKDREWARKALDIIEGDEK